MRKKQNEPIVSSFDKSLYAYTDTYRLADHPELLQELFNSRGLKEYLDHFNEMHRDNPTDVYHGVEHAHMTALNCFEGALYTQCTTSEIKVLLVAGLFHDALHSNGNSTEQYNIDYACAALRACHKDVPVNHQLTELELLEALKLIKLTRFPYVTKNLKTSSAKILRDADMMAAYCTDQEKLLRLFNGLLKEINVGISLSFLDENPIKMNGFCKQQLNFSTAMVWNTRWAKLKALTLNWSMCNRNLVESLQASKIV